MFTANTLDSFLESGAIISLDANNVVIGFGKSCRFSTKPISEKPIFYLPGFFLENEKPWIEFESVSIAHPVEVISWLSQLTFDPLEPIRWHHANQESFKETFHNLKALFQKGVLKKAVPITFDESDATICKGRLSHCLKRILQYTSKQPSFAYGYWENGKGLLGATPEVLFSEKEGIVKTAALAGTAHGDARTSLLCDPKERHEHQLVIDGIRESLKSFGSITTMPTEVLDLPTLSHLLTPIILQLDSPIGIADLVKAMHPTPALGAFPKDAGWQWLLNYQTIIDRESFGAPFGISRSEYSHCVVAIRNIQWSASRIKITAGCGVVAESILEKEWLELQTKIRSVKQILGFNCE